MQTGEAILVSSMDESEEWRDSPLLTSLRVKAFICLPVYIQEKPVAAMLALSPETMPSFTAEDRQVYFQIARQSSVILQNISRMKPTAAARSKFTARFQPATDRRIHAILKTLLTVRCMSFQAHMNSPRLEPTAGLLLPAVSGYDDESMGRIQYRS
jgi:GAF domain-containing protein